MANKHYGNVGDVFKHLALGEMLAAQQPSVYTETHSGSASYPFDNQRPRPRACDVRAFLTAAATCPDLSRSVYAAALRQHPGRYPGSMTLAMTALGDRCAYVGYDLDGDAVRSIETQAQQLGVTQATRMAAGDGLANVAKTADTLTGSGLLFLDPFRLADSVDGGPDTPAVYRNSANAGVVTVCWYPIVTDTDGRHARALLTPERHLEMQLPADRADEAGLLGCGLAADNISSAAWQQAQAVWNALLAAFDLPVS
jgi:23S rRNA A2030 N6-methylase RlmJ